MLQYKIMTEELSNDRFFWKNVIYLDFPSMLPLSDRRDNECTSNGILTPSEFDKYRARVLSKPLP